MALLAERYKRQRPYTTIDPHRLAAELEQRDRDLDAALASPRSAFSGVRVVSAAVALEGYVQSYPEPGAYALKLPPADQSRAGAVAAVESVSGAVVTVSAPAGGSIDGQSKVVLAGRGFTEFVSNGQGVWREVSGHKPILYQVALGARTFGDYAVMTSPAAGLEDGFSITSSTEVNLPRTGYWQISCVWRLDTSSGSSSAVIGYAVRLASTDIIRASVRAAGSTSPRSLPICTTIRVTDTADQIRLRALTSDNDNNAGAGLDDNHLTAEFIRPL